MASVFKHDDPHVLKLFSGKRATRNASRQYSEGPIEAQRDIMSNDPTFLKFKDKFSLAATEMAPPSTTEDGLVIGNGVRSNFLGLRHVNGFGQQPATWPLIDNTKMREDSGLSNKIVEDWHGNIFKALVRLFFSDLEPVPMKIRKLSSSCVPFFVTAMSAKQELAMFALENAPRAGKLFLEGKYEEAFTTWWFGGAYFVVYRAQSSDGITQTSDGKFVPKERKVADLQYAASGGREGSQFVASKEMGDVDFWVPDGFFRERTRTAMGGPWMINAALNPIAQSVRKRIYTEFPKTYHHTTRKNVETDLREWKAILAADVTQHDQYWPSCFLLDLVADELLQMGYADWWVEIYRTKGRLPAYVTGVGPGQDPMLLGDWTKPSVDMGLHSGNSFTDIEGTLLMTGVYLIAQLEHVWPAGIKNCATLEGAVQFVSSYLKGYEPIISKSKSDDALLGVTDVRLLEAHNRFKEKMVAGDPISPYMLVSYEQGGAFLGNILYYGADKDPSSLVLIGNINSWAVNQFSPEYGVQSQMKDRSRLKRPFPGLAWKSIDETFGSVPVYGELTNLLERTWFDTMGFSYRTHREQWLRDDERALSLFIRTQDAKADFTALTSIELEVLSNPDKLQYKYSELDVRDEVLDVAFNGLDLEIVEPYFNSIVNP